MQQGAETEGTHGVSPVHRSQITASSLVSLQSLSLCPLGEVMLIAISFLSDSLLAGIPQKVKFTVTTGHYTVKHGDSLQLSNVEAMLILCQAESRATIFSNSRGEAAATCCEEAGSVGVAVATCPAAGKVTHLPPSSQCAQASSAVLSSGASGGGSPVDWPRSWAGGADLAADAQCSFTATPLHRDTPCHHHWKARAGHPL